MTDLTEIEQTNGAAVAPAIFHEALDKLYRWMAENNAPDGMTTIRAKADVPGEPVLCADLQVVVYLERPETDPGEEDAA